jgi:hypothetical protein
MRLERVVSSVHLKKMQTTSTKFNEMIKVIQLMQFKLVLFKVVLSKH